MRKLTSKELWQAVKGLEYDEITTTNGYRIIEVFEVCFYVETSSGYVKVNI